jgi:hypothetical protein
VTLTARRAQGFVSARNHVERGELVSESFAGESFARLLLG